MSSLLDLLRNDNEENALVALKVTSDLHRTYKHDLESHVQPFLDIVIQMYRNMKQTMLDTFEDVSGRRA